MIRVGGGGDLMGVAHSGAEEQIFRQILTRRRARFRLRHLRRLARPKDAKQLMPISGDVGRREVPYSVEWVAHFRRR